MTDRDDSNDNDDDIPDPYAYNEYKEKAQARKAHKLLLKHHIENKRREIREQLSQGDKTVTIRHWATPVHIIITKDDVYVTPIKDHPKAERLTFHTKMLNGYKAWYITYIGTSKSYGEYLHQTVARAVYGNRPRGYKYHFIDGNKANPHPFNLTYVKEE